jgi:hypothetical protein
MELLKGVDYNYSLSIKHGPRLTILMQLGAFEFVFVGAIMLLRRIEKFFCMRKLQVAMQIPVRPFSLTRRIWTNAIGDVHLPADEQDNTEQKHCKISRTM